MKSIWLAAAVALCLSAAFAAQSDIALPNDGDDYSKLVARAQVHDAGVDFRALRMAYLKSAAYKRAGTMGDKRRTLESEMMAAMQQEGGVQTIHDRAVQILSIDYTDLMAQKLLRQSCALLHDDVCAELHHFVEFGLLESIMKSGDGKSCGTGWEAFQISEEYFVLSMMGATLQRQALVSGGGHSCDAMTVTDEHGATVTYYFNIDVMMAAEQAAIDGN